MTAAFGDVIQDEAALHAASDAPADGQPEIDINDPRLTSENIDVDPTGDAYAMPPVLPDGKWRAKLKARDVGKAPKTAKYLPKLDRNQRPYLYAALDADVIDHSGKFDGIGLTDYFVSTMIRRDGSSAAATVLNKLGKPTPKTTTHGQLINDLLTALAGEPEAGIETQWEATCQQCDEAAKKTGGRASVKRGMHNFPQTKNAKGEMEYVPRVKCGVAGHGEMVARPRINRYLSLDELKATGK
jgi:hypothetical protein